LISVSLEDFPFKISFRHSPVLLKMPTKFATRIGDQQAANVLVAHDLDGLKHSNARFYRVHRISFGLEDISDFSHKINYL